MARAQRSRDRANRKQRSTKQDPIFGLDLDFSNAPTMWKFLNDDSFFRGIKGPVGSGKSFGCLVEIMLRAVKQIPSPKDNVRYSRFAVIRNSYPELRTTTIKTWLSIFPENEYGPMRWSPPLTHHLKFPAKDSIAGVDCEVIFLALDQPKDVRKLLSLELTGAFLNEARELPLAVAQNLVHRVGRYPSKSHGGCFPFRGIWADTNPPADDNWWYRLAEKEPVRGKYPWKFFDQPGGMIETKDPEGAVLAHGRYFKENPKAENVNNLPENYYLQQLGGQSLDFIKAYVCGQYAFVREGRAVFEDYVDETMSAEDLVIDTNLPIHIGLDFGLTPACTYGQRFPDGRWQVYHETVSEDMGLERFAQILLYELNTRFHGLEPLIWGDPAGMKRDEIFEVTSFDHLRSLGLNAKPTASNDFKVRREAGVAPMIRLVGGKPALLIDKKCIKLRRSLNGGYHWKRVGVSGGTDRFRDAPEKNQHSHIGDSFAYMLLGGGEHRRLVRGNNRARGQNFTAKMDFDLW